MTVVAIDAGSRFARLSKWMLDRRLWPFFALVLIFYAAVNFYAYGLRFGEWDLLLLSGFATLIAGLMVVRVIPQRMHLTLGRLANRRVLKLGGLGQESLVEELEDRALRWAMTTALFTAVLVTAGFFLAFDRVSLTARIPLVALEAIAGYVAGLHLGRMASYGALGRFLKQKGCGIRVWPGHVDGAAGLKPLGDFYFFQAMVTAIPAMFLAAWWLLIPLRGERYARWRDPYLGGLAVAITLEVLAFVVPLLWFHREMVKAKRGLLEEADQLSMHILAHPEIKGPVNGDEGEPWLDVEQAKARYAAIEEMPTWPVDVGTRRRFSRNNVALVLPLLGEAVGQTAVARQVSEVLKGLS